MGSEWLEEKLKSIELNWRNLIDVNSISVQSLKCVRSQVRSQKWIENGPISQGMWLLCKSEHLCSREEIWYRGDAPNPSERRRGTERALKCVLMQMQYEMQDWCEMQDEMQDLREMQHGVQDYTKCNPRSLSRSFVPFRVKWLKTSIVIITGYQIKHVSYTTFTDIAIMKIWI